MVQVSVQRQAGLRLHCFSWSTTEGKKSHIPGQGNQAGGVPTSCESGLQQTDKAYSCQGVHCTCFLQSLNQRLTSHPETPSDTSREVSDHMTRSPHDLVKLTCKINIKHLHQYPTGTYIHFHTQSVSKGKSKVISLPNMIKICYMLKLY